MSLALYLRVNTNSSIRLEGTYKSNHFNAALSKFTRQLCECTEFSCADRCEIGRVGEKDGPAVVDPLVEVNLALGSCSLEVGGYNYVSNPNWFRWDMQTDQLSRDADAVALEGDC